MKKRIKATKARQRCKAFTLTELMIVVAIIGILSGISVVAFTRNWRDERVKAATRETTAWLDEVRRVAIQRASPCIVNLDKTNAVLSLVEQANSCNEPPSEGIASDDIASLAPRLSIQNSEDLIICSSDLTSADPASINLACKTSQTGNIQTTFTPRGSVTRGILLKLHMNEAKTDRCIAVIAPLGQIRSGRAKANGTCNFETAY